MKTLKIFIVFSLCLIMASCSVQENMSADIFLERLSKIQDIGEDNLKLNQENKMILFVEHKYILELKCNEKADVISLSLSSKSLNDDFILFAEKLIKVFSPDDDFLIIKKNIFDNKKISYYDTQWFTYCRISDDNGCYFSINNNKLNPQDVPKLTLKSNDKSDF